MYKTVLKLIGTEYPLTEKDVGSFNNIEAAGLEFDIHSYDAKGLGVISTMRAVHKSFPMTMTSIIVNPFEIDAPLVSHDRVTAMGNETVIIEPYNTLLGNSFKTAGMEEIKDAFSFIPETESKELWYDSLRLNGTVSKKGDASLKSLFDELVIKYFAAYLEEVKKAPACDKAEKIKKASVYTEGLLSRGGPATDPFMKDFGTEKTKELFRNYLFGTGENEGK